MARATPADLQFSQVVDDFVFGTLALSPVTASTVGYHVHHGEMLEDKLDDFSAAGIKAQIKLQRDIEARIDKLDANAFNSEQRADIEVMRDAIGATRLDIEEMQSYRHNPTIYVELVGNALYTPYVLHYAPAEERFKHIIQRLIRIPQLMRQAEANLSDSPEIWNKVAREENTGNIDLIEGVLRNNCPKDLAHEYDAGGRAAHSSRCSAFNDFLDGTLAKKNFRLALGQGALRQEIQLRAGDRQDPRCAAEGSGSGPGQDARRRWCSSPRPRPSSRRWPTWPCQHASPHTYMSAAKQTLAAATAFVKLKDLVSLPPNSNLQVIETPMFMRGIYGVGGFNQAPALEPKLGAFFWVTPIPDSWPQSRIDSKLREYNDSGLAHLTVHEAMPGHYVPGGIRE